MSQLTDNFDAIERQVQLLGGGRAKVLAVSKTFAAADIAELYAHGVRDFGESRVPELLAKADSLPPNINWHFIGKVQRNKLRKIVRVASLIHSIENAEQIAHLETLCGEEARRVAFLLEVNVSGEASKSGCTLAALPALIEQSANCVMAQLQGFMTMAPEQADEAQLAQIFGTLRQTRDELAAQYHLTLPVLSMGMSGDYQIALQQGATIVRVGSAIFGRRNYNQD